MRNYFIHELELENDRGAVEASFVFSSLVFITKHFAKAIVIQKWSKMARFEMSQNKGKITRIIS